MTPGDYFVPLIVTSKSVKSDVHDSSSESLADFKLTTDGLQHFFGEFVFPSSGLNLGISKIFPIISSTRKLKKAKEPFFEERFC